MGTPITSNQWMSSCYVNGPQRDAVVVKEKQVTIDSDTKEIISTHSVLNYICNPKRRVYITKKEFQTHTYKKETESLDNVETYTIDERSLIPRLKEILGFPLYKRMSLKEICNSPYIYGADVGIESLVRSAYIKNQTHPIVLISTGGFDIEASVLGDDRIIAITYVSSTTIYTAVLDDFMRKKAANGTMVKATVDDIYKCAQTLLKPYLEKYKFKMIVRSFTSELALIAWIFKIIHEEDSDYIGIWNLGYDIPKILARIKANGAEPEDIFCAPEVPKDLRLCKYYEDRKKTAHIVEKWNWLHCTAKFQFCDFMLLYARIHKTDQKEPSYKLNAIAKKVLGLEKLEFVEGSHYEMQKYNFVEYSVYNQADAIILKLMENQNKDCTSLYQLSGNSALQDYARQSTMLKNAYHQYCLEHKQVFASAGNKMETPYDHLFGKTGGAVLKADNTMGIGTNCISEYPDLETLVMRLCSDVDYSAIYPSFKRSLGISKETKLATGISIDGYTRKELEQLFGGIANPRENAVWIGNKFFKLPDYNKMKQLAEKEFIQH